MLFSSIFDSPRFWDLMENNSNKQGWNIPSVWGVVDKVTNGITDSYTDNEGAHIEVLAVGVTKDDISLKVNGSKVVTLDIKVLGLVPVHAFLWAGAKRGRARGLALTDSVGLAGPGESVPLVAFVNFVAQYQAQLVEVYATFGGDLR